MTALKQTYRVIRSILFSTILVVAGLYVSLYLLIAMPPVQRVVKGIAERELSALLGTKVSIGSLNVAPFSELRLSDVAVSSPDGKKCISVDRIGAGVRLLKLISWGKLEFTYAEVIGLDAKITQSSEGAPLNIQFLIDALSPKDKTKPPTRFDFKIRQVLIRKSALSFDRLWVPRSKNNVFSPSHIKIENLRADASLPDMRNDYFNIDLRKLSFDEQSGFTLSALSGRVLITSAELSVKNLQIALPGTFISPSDFSIRYDKLSDLGKVLKESPHTLRFDNNKVTPADFAAFEPKLSSLDTPLYFTLDVTGTADNISVGEFIMRDASESLSIGLITRIKGATGGIDNLQADFSKLEVGINAGMLNRIVGAFGILKGKAAEVIEKCGDINFSGRGSFASRTLDTNIAAKTSAGSLDGSLKMMFAGSGLIGVRGSLKGKDVAVGVLANDPRIGNVSFSASGDALIKKGLPEGNVMLDIDDFSFRGHELGGLSVKLINKNSRLFAGVTSNAPELDFSAEAECSALGKERTLHLNADLRNIVPGLFDTSGKWNGYKGSGRLMATLSGSGIDDIEGDLDLSDVTFTNFMGSGISLNNLTASSRISEEGERTISFDSDFAKGKLQGFFKFASIITSLEAMAKSVTPALIPEVSNSKQPVVDPDLLIKGELTLKPNNALTEFFNLPVRLLVDVPIRCEINGSKGYADLKIDIPYLQQGKDKLVRSTRLGASINSDEGVGLLDVSTILPGNNGDVTLNVSAKAEDNFVKTNLNWIFDRKEAFKGAINLNTRIAASHNSGIPDLDVEVEPSNFYIKDSKWNVEKSSIRYSGNCLTVDGINVWHDKQKVAVNGKASALPGDTLSISMQDMDLDYIFGVLNINFVTFGGLATGDVYATDVFTSAPKALTDNLRVKGLSYNGSELGDAIISSAWHNDDKHVGIRADISEEGRRVAIVDGGVWVTCDSLNFSFDTDRVRIGFLQPFMSAFCSRLSGRASGHANLYGNFHDIDMTGRLKADTISMLVDYTNVTYCGENDSVIIDPGRILIPEFKISDIYGKEAFVKGELRHRYFHDPTFRFDITDAKDLLVYDTSEKMNPDWYGTIYASGSGSITGYPGMVTIAMDMATAPKSEFTFVLSDTETAEDYHFLTFTDKRKERQQKLQPVSEPDFIAAFKKRVKEEEDRPSAFNIDLRVSVNPDAQFILVMDPKAGDKIKARGTGAMRIGYGSANDELTMYGKYTLDEGHYNFTLQDIIIKDFIIRPGSNLSFNGDPLKARLDIAAAYRVNTSLADLDKSFALDKDLNRTNVPVEAVLKVEGDIQNPDISFDVELPTLTQDVTRKVKSIISTEDMMNRQVIYLLALNRFYTPDYMGSGSNGSELASVASSTLSSQLTNMLGQLSDKWSVAPSIRSEKGDFSDVEMDLALSSRLLNNRLLLNGNFGYRDRHTSNTTFVGDFDIEYLLNRSGNLRLKAYNHYNDQNYYLKSALTTQGIGLVYKRDFDNPFTFLKRKKRRNVDSKKADKNPEIVSGNDSDPNNKDQLPGER